MKLVYTAFSKHNFYQRDIISQFCLEQQIVPLNPFKNWDYFMGDNIARDLVRNANNTLVERADELWQFGEISNGCFYEIKLALTNNKPVRFFKLGKTKENIIEIEFSDVTIESEFLAESPDARQVIESNIRANSASFE